MSSPPDGPSSNPSSKPPIESPGQSTDPVIVESHRNTEDRDAMDTMDENEAPVNQTNGVSRNIDGEQYSKTFTNDNIPPAISPIVSPEKDKQIKIELLFCAPNEFTAIKQSKRHFNDLKPLGLNPDDKSPYHFLFTNSMNLEESDIYNVKKNLNKLNKKVSLIAMKDKSNSAEFHYPDQPLHCQVCQNLHSS